MPRFKSRVHGFMQRKPHWICMGCGALRTVRRPASCTACGHRKYIYFASKKEYNRYLELHLMERAGAITELEMQPAYKLTIGPDTYKAVFDYRYQENGKEVIEDVKSSGTNTDLSKIKRSLAEAQHGIKVVLV